MFYLKFWSFEIDKDFSDNPLKFGTSSDIILQFWYLYVPSLRNRSTNLDILYKIKDKLIYNYESNLNQLKGWGTEKWVN